jgi:uncharacterized protein
MNTSIKVAAGHYFDLLHPDAAHVDIRSIASSLSKICRFGGHCPKFYSVAEHSVHAFEMAEADGAPYSLQKAVLLHDATEAYVGDMVKPLKDIMPQFQEAEARVERAVSVAFLVDFGVWHEDIKKYDLMCLRAERYAMWPGDTEDWDCLEGVEERHVSFEWLSAFRANTRFLLAAKKMGLLPCV